MWLMESVLCFCSDWCCAKNCKEVRLSDDSIRGLMILEVAIWGIDREGGMEEVGSEEA